MLVQELGILLASCVDQGWLYSLLCYPIASLLEVCDRPKTTLIEDKTLEDTPVPPSSICSATWYQLTWESDVIGFYRNYSGDFRRSGHRQQPQINIPSVKVIISTKDFL
jgi:hypothetical protein